MYDELTIKDIEKMKEEIEYRKVTLRPKLLEDVKVARAFGDLSENYEYKEAKRVKNRNESRIRYLTNMIKTAKIIEDNSSDDTVGLYDIVDCFDFEFEEETTFRVVTTIRNQANQGMVSKESPIGKKLLGRRVGDRVEIESPDGNYMLEIRKITKGEDDGSSPISSY